MHGPRGDKWNQITDASLMVSVWEAQQPQGHREEGAVHLQTTHQGQEGVCVSHNHWRKRHHYTDRGEVLEAAGLVGGQAPES